MSARSVLPLNCDDVRASLGAFALGVVDADENDMIDEHLAHCAECRDAFASALQTVGALALAVQPVAPSADARNRLMAAVNGSPIRTADEPSALETARGGKGGKLRPFLFPAVSIAAALLLIGVGVLGVLLSRAIDDRNEARDAAQLLSTYVSAGGDVVTMTAQEASIYKNYQAAQGSLLTAPGREPVVVVAGCPKSGDYLTYWVWFARDGERTPAGKLTVGGDGSGWLTLDPNLPLTEFDTIGITVVLQGDTREDVLVAPLGEEIVNRG